MNTLDNYQEENKNPNDKGAMTCLEIFCRFKGYQGRTLTQAIQEFKQLDMSSKDKFCGLLIDNMMNIADLATMKMFVNLRVNHLVFS